MRKLILGLMLLMSTSASSFGGYAYEYNGSATGLIADVSILPPVTIDNAGPLPAWGGVYSNTVASAFVGIDLVFPLPDYTVVSTGVLNASTRGGNPTVGQTTSQSNVAGITLLNGLISVGAVTSNAAATFNTTTGIGSTLGNSVVTGLVIGGQSITITGAANQVVSVELLGVTIASLTINEQVETLSPDGQNISLTVNALHLRVLNNAPVIGLADIIVAQSKAGVIQHVPEPSSLSMILGAFAVGGGLKLARRRKAQSEVEAAE